MKKILLSALLLVVAAFATISLSSCSKDDEEIQVQSMSGTSWKVTEDQDNLMTGVVMTFQNDGNLKLSKPVEGWNNPKWKFSTGKTSTGAVFYDLTITMEDGSHLDGTFCINVISITHGSSTHYEYNQASYLYGQYEKDQDAYNSLALVHTLTLEKQ